MAQVRALTAVGVGLVLLVGGCDRSSSTVSEPLDTTTSESTVTSPEPPPPPPNAFLGQLPPEETSQLNNLGVEVIVPGNVPPSFSLATIRTDQQESSTSYILVYQDAANRCFAVEFASEGIGDPPATQNRLPIAPPFFGDQGYGLNYGPFEDETMRAQFPESNLYTDWLMGTDGAYRLVGATYVGELFEVLTGCTDVAPEEAVTIVESFTPIDPATIGDGESTQ